jgi:integrase
MNPPKLLGMGRPIKPIGAKHENGGHFAYFQHPVRERTVCINLGTDAEYTENLKALNAIRFDPFQWHEPSNKHPETIRRQWLGPDSVVKLLGETAGKGRTKTKASAKTLARDTVKIEVYERKIADLQGIIERQAKEIEHWRGKKLKRGPRMPLREAVDSWFGNWSKRKDEGYAKTVKYDLDKFVVEFGADTMTDKMEGRETDINAWIQGMKVPVERDDNGVVTKWRQASASRVHQVRIAVLKMLTESGVSLDRKAIARGEKVDKPIHWLSRDQAENLAKALPSYYADCFRVQVAIGLRPQELLTLTEANFRNDYSTLVLAETHGITLKTDSRTIPIPEHLRPLLKLRAKQNVLLFPDPENALPWKNEKCFFRRYNLRLRQAATKCGIKTPTDCRIGRRTCASLLIQDNVSAEKVAALLGNTPEMILSHYGDPDIASLNLDKTAIGIQKQG